MIDSSRYEVKAPDWRERLRVNQRKTRFVIMTFVLIYLVVGLVVDCVYYAGSYPQASLSQIFTALLTFKIMPMATLIMLIIAAISLMITYALYDKIMLLGTDSHEVLNTTTDPVEKMLYNVVEELTIAAGLRYIPKIYIIEADYMNAFATGYSEKSALVAITRGLLVKLTRAEIMAVMAHELSHVRHADIKLTLTVGVLSNILLLVIDVLFYMVLYNRRSVDKKQDQLATIILILRYVLPILTLVLTLFLSRTREYMADAGCVELMRDNEPLGSALMKIHDDHQNNVDQYRYEYGRTAHEDLRRAAYLYDPVKSGIEPIKDISSLFSTHPSLTDRLKAIGIRLR